MPDEEKTQQICSLCFDEIMDNGEEIKTTTCGHKFHKTCFQEYQTNCDNKWEDCKCPNCRRVLSRLLINFGTLSEADDGENRQSEESDEDSMPSLMTYEEWREWYILAMRIPLIALEYHEVTLNLPNAH